MAGYPAQLLTHLIFHELSELCRVISKIDDVLHEEVLLHGAKFLVRILVLGQGGAWHRHPVGICVEHLLFVKFFFDHVLSGARNISILFTCYNIICSRKLIANF